MEETADRGRIYVWPAGHSAEDLRLGITEEGDWIFLVAGD